jgi:Ca2+-binding EF-hand superfamily protein
MQFMEIIKNNNKLGQVMQMIYEIDKDANGYVTTTELDDILKILYPLELGNKRLKYILKPFCSSANKVLLDYKQFRKFMYENLSLTKEEMALKFQDSAKKEVKQNFKLLNNDISKNRNASLKRLEYV